MPTRPLVSTDWLAEHLTDNNLRIVDIRGHVAPPTDPLPHYFNHHADYVKGHIPGAVFVDWVREITDPADPRHAKVAPSERFEAVMRRNGIGPETFVVAYDDAQGMFGARLWWMLNFYGHDKVAVLDGGWQKWLADGRPITTDVPVVTETTFSAQPQPEWLRTAGQVAAAPGDVVLMDARSPAEFEGKASRAARAGHIPGAVNVPRNTLAAADGTLLPPSELRAKFAQADVTEDDQPVITYCNGGVSAAYALMALRIAGFGNSTMYDGSWKEWGNDPDRPIE